VNWRQPKDVGRLQKEYDEHAALVMEGDDESTDDLARRDDLFGGYALGCSTTSAGHH